MSQEKRQSPRRSSPKNDRQPEIDSQEETQLLAIYGIFQRLRNIRLSDQDQDGLDRSRDQVDPTGGLFQRKFLLKLIDRRLQIVNRSAKTLAKQILESNLASDQAGGFRRRRSSSLNSMGSSGKASKLNDKSNWPQLEGFFYLSMGQIYWFILDLDWHDQNEHLDGLNQEELNYISSKLSITEEFLAFRKALRQGLTGDISSENQKQAEPKGPATDTIKSTILKETQRMINPKSPPIKTVAPNFKGVLSSRTKRFPLDTPKRRRRVHWGQGTISSTNSLGGASLKSEKSLKSDASLLSTSSTLASDSSLNLEQRLTMTERFPINTRSNVISAISMLAMELLLFSLNLFIKELSFQISEYIRVSGTIRVQLDRVQEARKKLSSDQLKSIAAKMLTTNDLYLIILDHCKEISNLYLGRYVIQILCYKETRLMGHRKRWWFQIPLIKYFIKQMGLDVERVMLDKLVDRTLQLFGDLVVQELNLPPVELDVSSKERSKLEIVRSRDNYLDLIAAFFKLDPKSSDTNQGTQDQGKSVKSTRKQTTMKKELKNPSSLDAVGIKSSARILAQMDNLLRLLSLLLDDILVSVRENDKYKVYFLSSVSTGFDQLFNRINQSVEGQSIQVTNSQREVDTILFRTRRLKLNYIKSCLPVIIRDKAARYQITLVTKSENTLIKETIVGQVS